MICIVFFKAKKRFQILICIEYSQMKSLSIISCKIKTTRIWYYDIEFIGFDVVWMKLLFNEASYCFEVFTRSFVYNVITIINMDRRGTLPLGLVQIRVIKIWLNNDQLAANVRTINWRQLQRFSLVCTKYLLNGAKLLCKHVSRMMR